MKYYFITGTGKGLGYALANRLLEDEANRVVGISRTNLIRHPNFRHVSLDLAKLEMLESLIPAIFTELIDPEKIILVNNAGTLGEIKYVGGLDNAELGRAFTVNFIAPAVLMNEFLRKYQTVVNCRKLILNISSGAGKKPSDGWSGYCASKAALDMFSEVLAVENQKDHSDLKVISFAPGIVDTNMQERIRDASKEDFSRLDEFVEYKKENMLLSPEKVAEKLAYVMDNDAAFHKTLLSIRELS